MARNYQTTNPQFIENFVYTPPYELMLQVASKKQAQYDNAISTAKLLGDVQIDHLNGEYDTANVLEKQRYYNDRANSIVEAIRKDPLNTSAYIGEIDKLQKELKTDFTIGDISKITGSKTAFTKWEEENKERLKDSPARYAAAKNAFFRNWGGDSLDSQWKGELVTQDVDWNKVYDAAEKIKASEYTQQSAGPSGGYIWKNKTTNERVTEEELMNNILGRVLTPDNLASLQQSERIGVGKYFKEDGTPDITYDENGKIISSASGWVPSRLFANSAAYNVYKQESDVQSDATAMTYVREAGANQRQQAGFAHDRNMKELDFQMYIEKEKIKNIGDTGKQISELNKIAANTSADPGLRAYAKNEAARLSGIGFIEDGKLPDTAKNISGLFNSNMKDPSVKSKVVTTLTELSKTGSPSEKQLFSTLIDRVNSGRVTTKEQAIEVLTQKAWEMYNSNKKVDLPDEVETIITANRKAKKVSNVGLGGSATITSVPVRTSKADIRRGMTKAFEKYSENSSSIIESKYSNRGTQFESAPLPYAVTQANLQYFNSPETRNSFIYRDMVTGKEVKDIGNMTFNNYHIGSANGLAETGHILTNQSGKKILAISTNDNSNINNAIKYNAIRSLPANSTIRNTLSNQYKQSIDTNFEKAAPKEGNVILDDPTGLTNMKIRRVYTPNSANKATYQAIDSYGNTENFANSDQLTEYLILSNQNK